MLSSHEITNKARKSSPSSRQPADSHTPVFYDETNRRGAWVVRAVVLVLVLVLLSLGCFVISIMTLPLLPHDTLPKTRTAVDRGNAEPLLSARMRSKRTLVPPKEKALLSQAIAHDQARHIEKRVKHTVSLAVVNAQPFPPVVAAFYVNWEETALPSLRRHANEITHFFPEWLHLKAGGYGFRDGRNDEDRNVVEPFVHDHKLPILPVLNNYLSKQAGSEDADWSTSAVHELIADPRRRTTFIGELKSYVQKQHWQGINIDFEMIPAQDRTNLTAFMRELYAAFHAAGLLVTQDIQLEDAAFDNAALAQANDFVLPMFYDEHSPGANGGGAGSIAGIGWTKARLKQILAQVPAEKLVMALGNYSYDWAQGDPNADSLTYQAAVMQAKESLDPNDPQTAHIRMDARTLNPTYRYYDDAGKPHTVWMLDATTAFNQWQAARPYHPRGVALWYLGAEDPGFWTVLGRDHLRENTGKTVDTGALDTISYGRQSQVDFEGEGELLRVIAEPNDGSRTITRDPKTGMITAQNYQTYPSSYVVRRYGYLPKKIVLTFDDGPDPVYTPQILDILKREGVHATFFVVGQNAELNPGLVARIWDEGNELGNHTYTHPNLLQTSPERTLLEITATQRVIEAVTGHTTALFRPPFAIDVEPRTGGELKSIVQASQYNFLAVGEKNDPQDWNLVKPGKDGMMQPRTAEDIVQSVWHDRDTGNVILLHDGGGNREATVAALPRLIEKLKANGYEFITVAQLRGVTREAMFPAVSGRDYAMVEVDRYVFGISYVVQRILVTLFGLSVFLGISRQVWMGALALMQYQKERQRDRERPLGFADGSSVVPVSVIIAAYNEEKVIVRTIETVLGSDYPNLEVVVVDDGSRDRTSEIVREHFADDVRVRCLRKENGGKASALNVGIAEATGEVIVALDADTLFTKETISRLVRHFADPNVGAVSGNVRVGNTNNLLTRWQSLEYITSQNFDRRAYDLLNCITVVPGAVGAWRRSALQAVGGYTSDTLAEDADLTWKVRRAGWRILNDSTALAFTEAPESLKNLARQRYRWAFGTLQNLWKHRDACFRHGAFGWFAIPSLWMYQILFPAISPIMDLTVLWALAAGSFQHVVLYYGLMLGVELLGAAFALKMDRGNWRLLPWLLLQRFVYRQMMYYVILKSVWAALRGGAVGWNKFERRGTVTVEPAA